MGLEIDIDLNSFQEISEGASQVMIYGFGHCKYMQLIFTLQNHKSAGIDKVFECSIGNNYDLPGYKLNPIYRKTSENRLIHQFKAEPLDKIQDEKTYNEKFCTRVCKTGAVNLIFENFLRKRAGLPIIPFIFLVDITENKYPYNPESFASSSANMKNLVTHSELRRCYKLINEFPDERIRSVATETFKFVEVEIQDKTHFFKTKEPFWANEGWINSWNERKQREKPTIFKEFPWREQLMEAVNNVDKFEETPGLSNGT